MSSSERVSIGGLVLALWIGYGLIELQMVANMNELRSRIEVLERRK